MGLFYNQNEEVFTGGNGGGQQVDWEALNKYIVETCDAEDGATLVGVISQFVDLGIQKQEDARKPTDLDTPEKQQEYLAKWKPRFEGQEPPYFEKLKDFQTGEMKWYERWKQRPQQCFTFAIDFPDIMLDKGQFFGDENSKPRPLRMYLGGEFYFGKEIGNALDRPIPASVRKTEKGFSFAPNSLIFKMASATKSLNSNGEFGLYDVENLIGKSCLFNIKVYLAEGKYLNQRISSPSPLMRGSHPIELNTDVGGVVFLEEGKEVPEGAEGVEVVKVGSISFIKENDENMVGELNNTVINRMRMASNWKDSVLRKQLEEIKEGEYPPFFDEEDVEGDKPKDKPKAKAPKKEVTPTPTSNEDDVDEDFDDDLPF